MTINIQQTHEMFDGCQSVGDLIILYAYIGILPQLCCAIRLDISIHHVQLNYQTGTCIWLLV